MKKSLLILLSSIALISCGQEQVDLIVYNSKTYTVNELFQEAEAFAIKDGKFVAIGSDQEILDNYKALDTINAQEKAIVPGLIDAHCHFYRMGLQQQKVSLEGTKSYNEVIKRLDSFQKAKKKASIL